MKHLFKRVAKLEHIEVIVLEWISGPVQNGGFTPRLLGHAEATG